MVIIVIGATGATGKQLLAQLLLRGHKVRAIVRSIDRLPQKLRDDPNLSVIQASILNLSDLEITQHVSGCDAVASCLGHNLTFKGIFGPPHKLVTTATRKLCAAIKVVQPKKPVKFVLMNTAGNRNLDLNEPNSFFQKCAIGLIRLLIPPHSDNEQAAEFLRAKIGQSDEIIEWIVVRPDSLINKDKVTDYEVYCSPTQSAIFNPRTTSRINVASFMAELITNNEIWDQWVGQMPVIYDKM